MVAGGDGEENQAPKMYYQRPVRPYCKLVRGGKWLMFRTMPRLHFDDAGKPKLRGAVCKTDVGE